VVLASGLYVDLAFVRPCFDHFDHPPLTPPFTPPLDPLSASHWAVGTFMLVSFGTWSVVSPLVLYTPLALGPQIDLKCNLTQDDMPAEGSRGAAAGTDCRRAAPQASAHEAHRLRVNIIMMDPTHGGIFTTRSTHL
jgi:hypothetical protein